MEAVAIADASPRVPLPSDRCQRPVVVAMVAVRVMQVAAHPVVYVITVRHPLVTAARTVGMARLMTAAAMIGSAAVRVFG
jgi:hypothetical protein